MAKCYRGHCWDNWEYLSRDCLLGDNIKFMLISLGLLMVWLCMRTLFFLGAECRSIEDLSVMMFAAY